MERGAVFFCTQHGEGLPVISIVLMAVTAQIIIRLRNQTDLLNPCVVEI